MSFLCPSVPARRILSGRTAISFDVDGAREAVNEHSGRLIEPKNVDQLVEACAELIADKSLRERRGRTGQESVRTKFAADTMVDTIEDVYENCWRDARAISLDHV